jgi:hypothetical protein
VSSTSVERPEELCIETVVVVREDESLLVDVYSTPAELCVELSCPIVVLGYIISVVLSGGLAVLLACVVGCSYPVVESCLLSFNIELVYFKQGIIIIYIKCFHFHITYMYLVNNID